MNVSRSLQNHIVIVGVLIIVVGLVTASDSLHGRMESIIVWTEGLISRAPQLGIVVFVLLAMVSAMVAFFSSAVVVPIAVYAWGDVATFVLLWVGWLLGGALSFYIGHSLGRTVAGLLVDEEKLAAWERKLGTRARFIHILIFQAVVPSEIPGYVLGTLRYRFTLYIAALAITEMPYALAAVYLGESFLAGRSVVFILLGIAVVVLGILVLRLMKDGDSPAGS
jgi:uncharacterized membrane protein YdjX (TVP38/TMEM64 family)